MTWGVSQSYPRAVLHIDGDAFFASCEVAKDPSLRGKPVITGKERGIVSACTYEAKSRGVVRGMKLHEAKRMCPDAVILPSDYETYSLFSTRMYAIARRYTSSVEEYGIDECFADITGLRRFHRLSYPGIAAALKRALEAELGMTFSIGLSCTKTLAKIGSKWEKPSGLTCIPLREAPRFLGELSTEKVWGIGPNTAAFLAHHGVRTAGQFARKDEAWVRAHLAKPARETWQELNGTPVLALDLEGRATYRSISKTKTFTPPSADPVFILAQLSKNVENACLKARRWHLATESVFFFVKTQDFRYDGCEVKLPIRTNQPHEILAALRPHVPKVLRKGVLYRATGITLGALAEEGSVQLDLFGTVAASAAHAKVYASMDEIAAKYGKHTVYLGSSAQAMRHAAHEGARGEVPARARNLFKGETARKRLNLPLLGEV